MPTRILGLSGGVMPLGWHLMLRLDVDRVLAPSVGDRRIFATTAGRFAHDLEVALGYVLELPAFRAVHCVPINDQWHLERTFHYILGQGRRHGLASDRWQDASAVHDLLGLRAGGEWLAARVRELMPRVTRERLLRHLDLEDLGPRTGSG